MKFLRSVNKNKFLQKSQYLAIKANSFQTVNDDRLKEPCVVTFSSIQRIIYTNALLFIYQYLPKLINNMIIPFPLSQFQVALSNTSKIKTSLQPFLLQFQKNNIQWMLAAINQISDYLKNTKTELNLAFNSLFALKFILDNANVVMAHTIQTFLLPIVLQIASFQIQNNQQMRGESYFIQKGYIGDQILLQRTGYNFVHIAQEIVRASSEIKPKVICFNEEVQQPSEFYLALQELQKKGFQSYKSFMFYEASIIRHSRNIFLKSLQRYHHEIAPFKLFFENYAKEYLTKGIQSKGKITPFKLLEKGEATAVQTVVKECIKSLKSAELNERTRALRLMSDLVRWGDITVAYQINCEGSVNELVREVSEAKEKGAGLGIERATMVLKKYRNSQKEKEEYYRELLKSLKLWGKCYPTAINSIDRVSNVKFLCGQLQKQGIQFPEYENIFAEEALFQSNRRKKLKYSQNLSKFFQKDESQKRISIISSNIDRTSISVADNAPLFQSFTRQIQRIWWILETIGQRQQRTLQNIQSLDSFYRQFDRKIQKGRFNCRDLHFLINQGVPLIERIEYIMPYLQQYKNRIINFNSLKTTLFKQNQQFKASQAVITSRMSSKSFQTNNSYKHNNLPTPKIDITESFDLSLEEILKDKFKNKNNDGDTRRRSSTNPQALLMEFRITNLMQSKQMAPKDSPNCVKIMNKLQSLPQEHELSPNPFMKQDFRRVSKDPNNYMRIMKKLESLPQSQDFSPNPFLRHGFVRFQKIA